ncbi:aminotransferase class III-fold pyridoxal phosphate-dependent enzyme [Chitiniphilus purpureus]|uniref:Aminotransferase class III-fold pyridoxal phosphate-dependent enzyme n=1 Tax=Chitiniphilus purpureus TaxID=2981137 RepID=A0ABY6DSZ7_9NEIS|nr:aminotransferase class III-fold pyridoxal phosphate-dependent enzyme [Chitiniphilus sp. CD1]UXY17147.1 aminotransferase class III-fold pyridoxal phosphate-dependent enzyme [Chitiniphilus sp. CD1]
MQNSEVLSAYRSHAAPYQTENLCDLVVETAESATLFLADGRQVIDMASGGFGYAHPLVKQSVIEQVKRGPLSNRILVNRALTRLVIELADWSPGDLDVSYICNSGEEALDSALKLAKGHWPTRHQVVVAEGGNYGTLSHGIYFAGIGAQYLGSLPFLPVALPFGDESAFIAAIGSNTAAVLLEPLNLDSGRIMASAAFWKAVRQRCDETGALLIVSELRTGLGRTGTRFAIEHTGIVPDVLVVGGALGGGHIAVGAYVTREPVNSKVYGRRNPTLHGSTTGANPAACAAALATLSAIEKERMLDGNAQFGSRAVSYLRAASGVRAVQHLGSLVAIDFESGAIARQVHKAALDAGLLLQAPIDARILLQPPLMISPDEQRRGLESLKQAIRDATVTQPFAQHVKEAVQ